MKKLLSFLFIIYGFSASAQSDEFTSDPMKANFITSDIPRFWTAYDSIGKSSTNPFSYYIQHGTQGLQQFIPYRILSADSLLAMVLKRKAAYETKRDIEAKIKLEEQVVRPYFFKLKELYPQTRFAPVYFVMGRFNSGGTSQKNGQIIGAEMLNDLKGLPNLVIHESIHFQQKFPEETTLLSQCLLEGTATFISGLITNASPDVKTASYVESHKDLLFREFVGRMNKEETEDWLYGTTKKDDRPNDLGYWLGARIAEAYYNKMPDKKVAVYNILNIKDFNQFLKQSGYLNAYLPKQ